MATQDDLDVTACPPDRTNAAPTASAVR